VCLQNNLHLCDVYGARRSLQLETGGMGIHSSLLWFPNKGELANRRSAPIAQEPKVRKVKYATTWIREGGKQRISARQQALKVRVLTCVIGDVDNVGPNQISSGRVV
jgi:hypothetical protein